MTDIIVDIMVEVLAILAIATKEVKRGRLSESMLCSFIILDLTDTSVQKGISGSFQGTQTSRTACGGWTG
jgi:tRNA-binding EMAP/Myf-like protein